MSAGTADVDRKLLDAIERLGRALRAARQRIATDLGLTTLQIEIIDRLDHLGPLPVGQLARELDVSQPTASDAVAALERKLLLERRRSPDDGRITIAGLTDTGQASADRIRDGLRALRPRSDDSRALDRGTALEVLLQEILRLQEAGVITINRSCLSCRHYQPPADGNPAHCHLLDTRLETHELRVDCPDHATADPES
ncbi:MarR family transcriptional regulator [Acidimicrobiia bacterium EGI L10123]|uniref:MarR family winged helix-turn-helix transcriptional regulator n=1 Tax=Salinilacustrithrix flava TaxID=2957203 RepID=UPI003D7C2ECF|nr:MarR family transcriptional regulator [Acidimicrobiia bacterium EGI L10123]